MSATAYHETAVRGALDAEQALLGALLFDGEVIRRLEGLCEAHHFAEPLHGRIFSAVRDRHRTGEAVDGNLLWQSLRTDPALIDLGGSGYIADLVDRAPPSANAPDYARAVVDHAAGREITRLASEAMRDVMEGRPPQETIVALRANLDLLGADTAPLPNSFIDARSAALQMLDAKEEDLRLGRERGARTGLDCFDRIGGLRPNDLVVLAGRPSMGKTALMRSGIYGAARLNPDRLFACFSVEMTDAELSERALADASAGDYDPITSEALHRSQMKTGDFARLRVLAEELPSNCTIDPRADLSVDDIRRAVWALKRKGDLAAIAIDYLQILRRPRSNGRADHAIIGEMTAELKRLAKEAEICVVLLSQLSRQVESREDKRPQLSDLRESGSIEQDAVSVMFCYRESYYLERSEPKENTAEHKEWEMRFYETRELMEVLIQKNRHGSIGTTRQRYQPEFDRIENRGDRYV